MAYEDTAKDLVKAKGASKKAPVADEDDEGVSETDDEMDSYDDVEDSAADELANLVGVKDKAAFASALRDYISACVRREMSK